MATEKPPTFTYQGRPRVELLEEGDRFILLEPWWFAWAGPQWMEIRATIPAGFPTDFASIPRVYRWRFSPTGRQHVGALAHDYLYREGIVPRNICDQVFLDAMEACGVGWWSRHVMHRAVRMFGGGAYGKGLQVS